MKSPLIGSRWQRTSTGRPVRIVDVRRQGHGPRLIRYEFEDKGSRWTRVESEFRRDFIEITGTPAPIPNRPPDLAANFAIEVDGKLVRVRCTKCQRVLEIGKLARLDEGVIAWMLTWTSGHPLAGMCR